LVGHREVKRTLRSVGGEQAEAYKVSITAPTGVDVKVRPMSFEVRAGESVVVAVTLQATQTTGTFTFGALLWRGDKGHAVRVPLAVLVGEVM